jgi:hypothetical protein
MASPAQINANRQNAQHSTGPRTPEGKARSAANSLKDGFHSSRLVIPEEMRAEFDEFRSQLLKTTAPANVIEEQYYRRLLLHGWNLQRIQDAETQALLDSEGLHRVEVLAKYRRDLERSYDRALKQLRELQAERVIRSAAPPELRRLLAADAPLALPPPIRPMSREEELAMFEKLTAPPKLRPQTLAESMAEIAAQDRAAAAEGRL